MIKYFIAIALFTNAAFADCDFKQIQKVDGGYLYTKDLHVCVGEMKQDLEIANKQNEKYIKALDLKEIAIGKANQRADLWMDTSFKLEDRINTMDRLRKSNETLYFGLGILTMFAAGYMASQLKK